MRAFRPMREDEEVASCPPPPRPLRICGAEALTRCCGPADAPFDLLPAGRQAHAHLWLQVDLVAIRREGNVKERSAFHGVPQVSAVKEGRAEQDLSGHTS